jgi:outer membrane protein TolC
MSGVMSGVMNGSVRRRTLSAALIGMMSAVAALCAPAPGATPAATPAATPSATPAATSPATPAATSAPSPQSIVLRLTLAETVERARQASPLLAQLRSLESAAAAGSRGARAQGLPIIDLSAGYTRWSDVPDVTVPLAGGGTQVIYPNIPDNYQSRLGLRVPIYTGGRVSGTTAAAEHERTAAAHDVESGTGDATLEAQSAYWDLVAAREEERVLREAIASYEAHIKETRDREQVGMAARNDVLAVQVDRDRAELGRLRAANAAEIANADLQRILGLDPATRVETADPLERPVMPESGIEALVAEALVSRPERAALSERVAAAQERVRAQKAGYLPSVGLSAGYDYSNPNRRIFPPAAEWQDTWDAGVSLSFTLYDSGRTSAAVEQSSAQADAARHQLEDLDRRIRLEVVARALDLGAASEGIDVATRNVAAATENQRVSGDRYREGLVPSSDLLDAETALLRSGLDRVDALAQARLAAARLDRAIGK